MNIVTKFVNNGKLVEEGPNKWQISLLTIKKPHRCPNTSNLVTTHHQNNAKEDKCLTHNMLHSAKWAAAQNEE